MGYKMAIIGFGGMGGWHYENVKKCIPEITMKGVYDIRPEAQENAKNKGLHVYVTADELYADKELDLVLVSTPNDTHAPYAIACMEAGKNVICEKPVTLSVKLLDEILAVSEKTGKFFTVHQNRRWDRDFLTVKKIFEDEILQQPYTIESRVQGSRQALHGWRGYKQNGGGMVLDWGVHLMDQMLNMMPGKVVGVTAHLHQVFAPEVDDDFTAMFRFDTGLTYLVNIAMNCFIQQPRWHVSSEDGTALVQNWECEGKIVKLADKTAVDWTEEIIYTAAGPTRSMAPRPKETTVELPLPKVQGEWADYYKNIVKVLAGEATPIVTKPQIRRLMQLIEAVFASNESKAELACEI